MTERQLAWRGAVLAVLLVATGGASCSAAQTVSAPTAKLTPACRAGQTYLTLAGSGKQDQMGTLFADKVDYIGPDGKALSTRAEVSTVYAGTKASPSAKPYGVRIVNLVPIRTSECLMEFEQFDPATGASFLLAIDHFKVNKAGKVIYFRPFLQTAALLRNPVYQTVWQPAAKGTSPGK